MSDIVHWLRKLAALVEADHAPQHVVMHMRAGADEIERLRAGGCARDQGTTQYCAEAAKKDAEISRLLNLLADARTESMKLRAALERIADTDPDDGTEWFHNVARAALDYRKMGEGRT